MRAVLDLRNCELLRCLGNSGEIVEILVMLSTFPDLDLPCSVVGTGLHNVYIIIFDDLLSFDRLQTLRTERIGLADLLRHRPVYPVIRI